MLLALFNVLFYSQLSGLGPGARTWHLTDPAVVGLSRAKLDRAAREIGGNGSPLCLAIAKDGELVLDRQFGFGAKDRSIES